MEHYDKRKSYAQQGNTDSTKGVDKATTAKVEAKVKGIEAAALGASESSIPGNARAEALLTFTLDSGASRCFFCDSSTLTPLPAPVPVRQADPSGGPVVARSSTVLPCPAIPSSSVSCLHLPLFSTNLVSTAALQDAMVTTTTPGSQRVSICTCTRTGRHMATFTRRPGSSLYTLATEPPQVAASAQMSASGQVAPPCSCRLLSHHTLLWHHRLGHPSLPRLRGMHSRLLVSGLPRSLPPLPPSPAPPCLPCVEGRQRAAPHSSSFPPMNAPLRTLHMDVWGPARSVSSSASDSARTFLSYVCTLTEVQNGIAERRIGLVMEVARTSMIRAATPHFLWPFAVRYAAHQLNLWPSVSLPETSPTLCWTGKVGDVLVFCVWGSHAFVRDPSADKLSTRTIPCVFLGFSLDAPGWQFYHPTSCLVFPSHDVTFDELVPFYRLFPYRSATPPPPPLFLAPGPPPVDPLPPKGPAPSCVSQVDPLLGNAPVEGAESEGAGFEGAEPAGAKTKGAESKGVEPGGVEPQGVEPGGAESEGAESRGAVPLGASSFGGPAGALASLSPRTETLSLQKLRAGVTAGASGTGGAAAAGPGGALIRGTRAVGTGSVGGTGAGGVGAVGVGAGGTGAGGAGARGVGAVGAGAGGTNTGGARAGGAGAVDPGAGGAGGNTELGAAGARGAGAVGASAGGTGAGGAGTGGAGAVDPGAGGVGGTVRPRPYFVPLLQQVLGVLSSTGLPPPLLCPIPNQSQPPLQPASPLPAPSPYNEQSGGLTEHCEPASRPISPVRTACRVPRSRPPPVPCTHAMALRLSSAPLRVPLSSRPESSLPAVPDPESGRTRAASPTVSRLLATVLTSPSFESTIASALVAELLDFATACRLDYTTALVADSESASPPFVGGEYALGTDLLEDRQEDFECLAAAAAMDAEMASWKSTGTYVDEVPPPGANIVDGMWIFRVKRPPGSPPAFKARFVARGFSQRHSVDYFQTFSPTLKMTTLRRPVYGLRQAPREWYDTLRTTLAALGFAPSTADPSLLIRTNISLPLFYVLVYVDDLVFATADTEALTLITRDRARRTITLTRSHMVQQVLQRFGFQFSSPQPTPLSTGHSLSAPPSDESVEPSGPYLELVGCLMYLMTYTRPGLVYPLSHLARYMAPGRHRKVHWDAAKRVLGYLCSTSGMGLVLGGRGPVVLTGLADASWVDDSATERSSQGYTFSLGSGSVSRWSTCSSSVLSSSCEAEIYAGAMAAQELRWLTYLPTDLGEQPRSPPVLYVDHEAMIALCQEHRLEHITKHIALHYFLARELQQRGQLRLAYVATRANTADIFTKALSIGDHERFSTVLGLALVRSTDIFANLLLHACMAPATLVGARVLRQGVCASLNVGALERASTSSACRSVGTRALVAAAAASVAADARGLEQGGARLSVRAASRAAPGGPLQANSGGGGEGAGLGRGRIAGWACVERCGACCQLDKGELAPPIETILRDPSELAVYRSMVGADGWCRHYDKDTRACRIYDSRPRFCRVEADVFWDLYSIAPHQLAATARSFCRVSIADLYGPRSDEMKRFKAANRKRPCNEQQ
ncbi:unnamed protein product [Closterium sp. NIES-53]